MEIFYVDSLFLVSLKPLGFNKKYPRIKFQKGHLRNKSTVPWEISPFDWGIFMQGEVFEQRAL